MHTFKKFSHICTYHRQQNKCYPRRCQIVRKTEAAAVMKFDRSNKFDLCYYGQVNTFGGNIYFAGDGTEHIIIQQCNFYRQP